MSNNSQNRLLMPARGATTRAAAAATPSTTDAGRYIPNSSASISLSNQNNTSENQENNNQLSVDDDFDSYWEEEARNPHRNRIRIGRQYQATVPALLKHGEKDQRKLEDLETLSFCPKKSSRLSDAELNHYFTIAKSLNIFASLVETRSLLGRDVTIADLNHIRDKEGLSLASVIQPNRQTAHHGNSGLSPTQQQSNNALHASSPQKSPQQSLSSPRDQLNTSERLNFNQPLMKALSHFISLHHPCHHNSECKKLLKETPLDDDTMPTVSITAGNLRQGSSAPKESKVGRSRSSIKQAINAGKDETSEKEDDIQSGSYSVQSPSYDDWTREELELFSKAIEICGKNFGTIKKDFLPSKSVKSIVEYYYIGSRDAPDAKRKPLQAAETSDVCSSPGKTSASNNGQGGGGGGGSTVGGKSESGSGLAPSSTSTNTTTNSSSRTSGSKSETDNSDKKLSDAIECARVKDLSHSLNPTLLSESNSKMAIGSDIKTDVKPKVNNFDARMSVYNFDEENKDDSPLRLDCPRPGAEVKPLKAKPILPGASIEGDAAQSNVGSLKFFMDGQLVLKLNACQEQQEGIERCHWVQSGDKIIDAARQKRYVKRGDRTSNARQNGSQADNSSHLYNDDDYKDDASIDEDSKESMTNSSPGTPLQRLNSPGSKSKRLRMKSETNSQNAQLSSPVNYNGPSSNSREAERNDSSPMMTQAVPWLQANGFAVAAALLGGLSFPANTGSMIENPARDNIDQVQVSSKPMDLTMEHNTLKPIQQRPNNRSRTRQFPKNA